MMDPRFDEMFAFISSHRRAQRTSPEKWRLIEPSSAARCEISEACRGRGRDQAACRAIFVRLNNTRSVAIPKQGRALQKAHSKRRERHHKKTDDLRAQLRCCQKVSRPGPTCSTGRANVKSTADAYTKSSVSRRRRRPWASTFLRSRRMASLARF